MLQISYFFLILFLCVVVTQHTLGKCSFSSLEWWCFDNVPSSGFTRIVLLGKRELLKLFFSFRILCCQRRVAGKRSFYSDGRVLADKTNKDGTRVCVCSMFGQRGADLGTDAYSSTR